MNKCEVFQIKEVIKHPNADKLGIVQFYNYEAIVRLGDFKSGDLAVYIPPDSLVPLERDEFKFLAAMNKSNRIRAQKLRGYQSQGLVIPCPKGHLIGEDLAEYFGISHYNPVEPPIQKEVGNKQRRWFDRMSDRFFKPPKYQGPYYDIESWFRYPDVFEPTDVVVLTEKIHGMNGRYTYQDGKFHCCSRKFWRQDEPGCPYWAVLKRNKWLQNLCKLNPGLIVYGEIYGDSIQKEIKYNQPIAQFKVFDIYDPIKQEFLDWHSLLEKITEAINYKSKWERFKNWLFGDMNKTKWWNWWNFDFIVPVYFVGQYSDLVDNMKSYISGRSDLSDDIREGVVIKTREHESKTGFGRKILKAVNPEYLER